MIRVLQTPQLAVDMDNDGPSVTLIFSGEINEECQLKGAFSAFRDLQAKELIFDLGQVTRINSVGSREWILFLERAQSLMKIRFIDISVTIVEQATIVSNLLGKPGTEVLSFQAPFFCVSCKKSQTRRLATSAVLTVGIPPQLCEECSKPLQLDAIETEYFGFLKHIKATR